MRHFRPRKMSNHFLLNALIAGDRRRTAVGLWLQTKHYINITQHWAFLFEQQPKITPAKRKRAPPVTAMRVLVAGLLSPTFVHFMPTTLTMMPIKPSSTDTTIKARHVWMWTRWRQKKEKGGRDSRVDHRALNDERHSSRCERKWGRKKNQKTGEKWWRDEKTNREEVFSSSSQ